MTRQAGQPLLPMPSEVRHHLCAGQACASTPQRALSLTLDASHSSNGNFLDKKTLKVIRSGHLCHHIKMILCKRKQLASSNLTLQHSSAIASSTKACHRHATQETSRNVAATICCGDAVSGWSRNMPQLRHATTKFQSKAL